MKNIINIFMGILFLSCSLESSNESHEKDNKTSVSTIDSKRSITGKVDITSYSEIHRATGIPIDSNFSTYKNTLDGSGDSSVILGEDNFQYLGIDTNNYWGGAP